LYRSSRTIVLPSTCLEVCPAVVAEAMFHGRPVVASRIGGLPSIVEDGVTGLLAEPGNTSDLAAKIRTLWEQPKLCARMGAAARSKARTEYSPDVHYERLMAVYESARSLTSRTRAGRECKRVCRPIET
jgi:glycosyltransferase involved in cell wall biosynthesis